MSLNETKMRQNEAKMSQNKPICMEPKWVGIKPKWKHGTYGDLDKIERTSAIFLEKVDDFCQTSIILGEIHKNAQNALQIGGQGAEKWPPGSRAAE